MFNATDDDDFFSTPTSTSNLANLFGSNTTNTDLNASLIYSAPKQPKSVIESDDKIKPKPAQNKLICVKTILLYKINETSSSSTLLGKYGIAIIGDVDINSYDLIIYKTKQQILSTTKLTPNCKYRELPNHQATLKDDQSQLWRVHFDDAKESTEFTAQLKSKGVKVIQESEKVSDPIINTISMSDNKVRDEIKLDDSDSSGAQARLDILERISKVGQSMLPANTPKNLDLSESEPEEIVKAKKVVRKPKRHSTSDKDLQAHISDTMDPNQYMVPKTPTMQQQQYTLLNGQYVPTQMIQCMPSPMLALNDPLSIYFTENRTHNSEVRMNLSHLSNKLESVLNEISFIKTSTSTSIESDYSKNKFLELEKRIETLSSSGNGLQKTRDMLSQVEEEKQAMCIQMEKLQNDLEKLKYKEILVNTQQSLINELNNTIENQKCKIAELETNENEDLKIANKELCNTVKILKLKLKDFEDQKLNPSLDKLEADKLKKEDLLRVTKLQEENDELKVNINELQGNIVNLKLKLKDFDEYLRLNPQPDKLQAAKLKEEEEKELTDLKEENANLNVLINELEGNIKNLEMKLKDFEDYQKLNPVLDKLETARLKEAELLRFTNLEAENVELKRENADLNVKINELEGNIENLEMKFKDFEDYQKLNPILDKMEAVRLKEEESLRFTNLEEENVDLKDKNNELENKIDNMKLKIKDFEEYHSQTYQPDKLMTAKLKEDKIKNFNELVKQNMNEMYQNILERMDENSFNSTELKKSLTSNMKNATFQILDEYRNSLNEHINELEYICKTPPPVPEFEVTV